MSSYSDGLMGYRTPNIDRIADEGMCFTDSYGEQSCTAGRAAFITGQSAYSHRAQQGGAARRRPGNAGRGSDHRGAAEAAWVCDRPVWQEPPRRQGRAPADVHGFDEFFGNLYHLNAEEEPEHPDYPDVDSTPGSGSYIGPRGVLRCRVNRNGRQVIEDTGPLTKKRMETIDDEIIDGALDFIERKHAKKTPFFLWVNTTHMHFRTHPKRRSVGQAGRWQSPYHDTMIDHDKHVGKVLDKLDKLGITEDTIVIYSTDNGAAYELVARCRR